MNRRSLLQDLSFSMLAAKLSGASSLYGQAEGPQPAPSRRIAANDRVSIGFIGPGSRGQELVRQLLRTPGVEIAAQCDVYGPRFAEVNEMVGKNVPAHKDYRELLQRKDLDAIFIPTPLMFHATYAITAMKSGRPVYCEKTVGFTQEDCAAVVDATRTACGSFVECVRNKQQPFANVDVGFGSGIACSTGRQALYEERVMKIPAIRA
ncbi:MAG: Gfo/Idh/MocA family protein [Acidobacteriaceae bacterium]